MNKILKNIITVILLLLGLLIQLFGVFLLFKGENILGFIFFFAGFCLSIFSKNFGDFKLFVVKAAIALAILFLFGGVFMYSFNSSSEDITNSIQPSIDILLVSSIDQVIETQVLDNESREITLILGKNKEEEIIYSNNITKEQASRIANSFSITNKDIEIIFSRMIIKSLSDELKKNNLENVGIPLDSVASQYPEVVEQVNLIDFAIFQQICSLNEDELNQFLVLAKATSNDPMITSLSSEDVSDLCFGNEEDFIKIVTFEEEITKKFNPQKLEEEDVNLIWENLELPEVSYSSKETITKIALSLISDEIDKLGIDAIPVSTIADIIPQDIKNLVSYDILSDNLTQRVDALEKIRNDCNNEKMNVVEICDAISITEYENLIENVSGLIASNSEEFSLPINVSPILEKIETTGEIQEIIDTSTSIYPYFFIISVALFVLSIVTAIMHKKDEETEINNYNLKIGKFLSRVHLIDILTYYFFVLVVYIGFSSGFIFNKIKEHSNENVSEIIDIVTNLPILLEFFKIIEFLFLATTIYFIFSLILYLTFIFLNKEKMPKKRL